MTDQYAVIDRPIGHTKSPLIHGLFAESCGQTLSYVAIEVSGNDFAGDAARFRAAGGRGLNITVPFTLDAFRLVSHPSDRAQLARAANAFKFEDERILAEIFDGIGLLRDIEVNLGNPLRGRRVLLLGAGSAVRGALLPFLDAGPAGLVLANRDRAKAQTLLAEVDQPPLELSTYEALDGQRFDMVINATSASLSGELPPVPPGVFATATLAYELANGKDLPPSCSWLGNRAWPSSPTALACWWSKRRKPSDGGAACAPRPGR